VTSAAEAMADLAGRLEGMVEELTDIAPPRVTPIQRKRVTLWRWSGVSCGPGGPSRKPSRCWCPGVRRRSTTERGSWRLVAGGWWSRLIVGSEVSCEDLRKVSCKVWCKVPVF
jgi:hypothetical protein